MEFNHLLEQEGLDRKTVLVLRHTPREQELFDVMPWLITEKPAVFNAYQQTQSPRVAKKMVGADYVASFFGHESGKAVFVGLYEKRGSTLMTRAEVRGFAAHRELLKYGLNDAGPKRLWFDLVQTKFHADWQGKLIIRWPTPEVAWSRWAKGNQFEIEAILDESIFVGELGNWRELVFTWDQLQLIPKRWKDVLSRWRGVYFIWDSSIRKGYVGSAYGKDKLLGRWLNYAKTGHGGNKLLKLRKPQKFHFSILEWAAEDMEDRDILEREKWWKARLHTKAPDGLNDN